MFDPSARLFMRFRGKTTGPFSLGQIEQMRQLGRLTAFHEVSADGVHWVLAINANLVTSTGVSQHLAASAPLLTLPTEIVDATIPPWYYLDASGDRQGPISREQMGEMVAAGKFTASSEVWCEGFPDWVALDQTELADFLTRKQGTAKGPTPPGEALGNGLVVAGYLCCVGSLFLCPPVFGVAALVCAVFNLTHRRVTHGLVQLFLSIVLSSAGSYLGYLIWQELSKQ